MVALANPYRRELLVAMLEHNPQDDDNRDPLGLLDETEVPDVLESELVHNHLPKLEEMGYITWNRETGELLLPTQPLSRLP
ncbi:ArsR family transcriptional regulator [Halobacteria archaeon AArc-curdl1]|uniref:ArsR family transcriptional regulator n=1 Tax=Natronosalvus hydrolyticus TaxID=2979988 RepID=A0AAP2Z747_9EURY|nr:ArsR family transcriptional regulator [Halobacteria archaeon AArc-curdl1]